MLGGTSDSTVTCHAFLTVQAHQQSTVESGARSSTELFCLAMRQNICMPAFGIEGHHALVGSLVIHSPCGTCLLSFQLSAFCGRPFSSAWLEGLLLAEDGLTVLKPYVSVLFAKRLTYRRALQLLKCILVHQQNALSALLQLP